MKQILDKIKESWPFVLAVLKALPSFLFKTKAGRVILTMILLKLGIKADPEIIEAILEFIGSGVLAEKAVIYTPATFGIINDLVIPALGIYGIASAKSVKTTFRLKVNERLPDVL